MHETLYPITRIHKLKWIEEEFLKRMRLSDVPAYQKTAQEFFTYIAEEQQKEEEQRLLTHAKRKHYRTRITYEAERMLIQEVELSPWGHHKDIAKKYNISIQQLRTILYKQKKRKIPKD